MSEKELNEIQTKIALLEKDAKTGEQIHRRLEIAIDKLSDCAISLKGMLAQQEQKLAKAEQTDDDIFITLESRRKEWDNDLKELHSRITTNSRELREHQVRSEQTMLNELRAMKTQLSERVGVLEKWRWLIIGGSIIIGLMMSNPSGNIWEFLN
jgi:chromosome segregation ATPase